VIAFELAVLYLVQEIRLEIYLKQFQNKNYKKLIFDFKNYSKPKLKLKFSKIKFCQNVYLVSKKPLNKNKSN